MTFAVELSLCIMAWTLTISRFKSIHWQDLRKDGDIALHIWLMMVFFSITSVFLIKKFSDFFDAYTFNNLDRLIAYSSILIGMTFGTLASIEAVGQQSVHSMRHWLFRILLIVIAVLVLIYSLYLSRISDIRYFVPRSLPEALFMLLTFALGVLLSATVGRVYWAYLPSETSSIMRARAILFVVSSFIACGYFIVKIIIAVGYFWHPLASRAYIDLSWVLLVTAALSHFSALMNNRIYARFVVISRNIRSWNAFQDLRYLKRRLLRLCPEVSMSTSEPSFWRFVLNPEHHLYRTVVTIMDGKTVLDDLLSEGALHGEPPLWEGDMLREVVRMKQALHAIKSTGDFWEIMDEYREASRNLLQSEHEFSKENVGHDINQ